MPNGLPLEPRGGAGRLVGLMEQIGRGGYEEFQRQVQRRGRMWDIGADGYTAVVRQGKVLKANHVDGAALVKSWL